MSDSEKVQIRTVEVAAETPVFICDLSLIKPQLDLARMGIEELRVSHPDTTPSNVQSVYMSPWHSHLINNKFKPLTDSAVTIAQEVSRTHLSANLPSLNMGLVVTDCWGAIYETSDYTKRHNHFPAEFSCVIYLEVHENSAPIIFSGKLHIQPKPNMMVLFPGILQHEVPATDGRRVVVAMNMNKRAIFDGMNK
jgi:hypothetical protein